MARLFALILVLATSVAAAPAVAQVSEPDAQVGIQAPAYSPGDPSGSPEFRITNERFEENIQLAITRLVARTISEICFPCCFCCGPDGDCCDECNDKNLTAIPPSGD